MNEHNKIDNAKRVVKNSTVLYVRMFIVLLIGAYTSRVVLQKLGVDNYGIYNLVGGVMGMFGFLTSSLTGSMGRFITFALGTGDKIQVQRTFSTSFVVMLGLSLFMVLLIETVGIWFLETKLSIPAERMWAAHIVLQCMVVGMVVGLCVVPFNMLITAHEHMGVYSYVTIVDVTVKLLVLFCLTYVSFDKLIVYTVLYMIAGFVGPVISVFYCKKHFSEVNIVFSFDRALLKEIGNFSIWSLLGNLSWMLNAEGVSIILNMFFGVAVNAARGVAGQVENIVQGFVGNFMAALNPQITKSYASGDTHYTHQLLYAGTRVSFCMILLLAIPVLLEVRQVLSLWFGHYPPFADVFAQISVLTMLMMSLGNSLTTAQGATGHVRKYALVMSGLAYLAFPITYICFKLGMPPYMAYISNLLVYGLSVFAKIGIVKSYIGITYKDYIKNVVLRVATVAAVSFVIPFSIHCLMEQGSLRLICVTATSIPITLIAIYFLGLYDNERALLDSKLKTLPVFNKIYG